MGEHFFAEKRAAAVLKHGILGRYLRLFCSKTGYGSRDHRVVYLDGYAGQGTYDDGQPGSPDLAVATAKGLARHRQLFGIYVEKDAATAIRLQANLATTSHEHKVLIGSLEEQLEEALALVGSSDPLFAFFDPFGLGITLEDLVVVMAHADFRDGSRHGPATEVLLNFSHPGLRRTAGHLTASGRSDQYLKARKTTLKRLDATLGGDWWRAIWKGKEEDRTQRIADEYVRRVAKEASVSGLYRVPVRQRLYGPVVYDLVLLTQCPQEGLWHFNECVSLALEDFYSFYTRFRLDLDPKAEREQRWVKTIRDNVKKLVDKDGEFTVWKSSDKVFGDYLGYARETHLRSALKELYKDGIITHDGKGELKSAVIQRRCG